MTLVIPGAIALGAYEAGALTVLINAIRASNQARTGGPRLIVDTIAGASAGAMTAALVAYVLLTGADPGVLQRAWVEEIDVTQLLKGDHPDTAFSRTIVQDIADNAFIQPGEGTPKCEPQAEPIRLVFALTNLTGRNTDVRVSVDPKYGAPSIGAATYADWMHFRMKSCGRSDWNQAAWDKVKSAALASGAVPVAFEPKRLPRDGEQYVYVDGGVWNSKPLGYAIDATYSPEDLGPAEVDQDPGSMPSDDPRLFVIVEITAEHIDEQRADSYFTPQRIGIDSLLVVPRNQSIGTDLRRLATINSQVRWLNTALDKVKTIDSSDREVQKLTGLLYSQCQAILGEKLALKPAWKPADQYSINRQPDIDPGSPTLVDALRLFSTLVGGLRGKQPVEVSTIQPADESYKDKRVLAGALLGDFGGFLFKPLRQNDYTLGCERAGRWLLDSKLLAGDSASELSQELVKNASPYPVDPAYIDVVLEKLPSMAQQGAYDGAISAVLALADNLPMEAKRRGGVAGFIWSVRGLFSWPASRIGVGLSLGIAAAVVVGGLLYLGYIAYHALHG